MPNTKQKGSARQTQAIKHAQQKGGKSISNPRLRSALGDDYKSHGTGLGASLERAFDPDGKAREQRRAKRMAEWSYGGKANPKPHAVKKK